MADRANIQPIEPTGSIEARPGASVAPDILREHRIVMGLYNDPRADIFRVLRTTVLRQLRENRWNSFAITSTAPNAGKTFVAVNLALAIALEGNQDVILVDADLRRPRVAQYLGFHTGCGLVDYLMGRVSLSEILVNPGFERFRLLPGGASAENPSELVSSPRMSKLVEQLKSQSDPVIIIFDIPPIFVADDVLLFMSYFDAALLVTEDGKDTSEELLHAMHILEETNLLGFVLNKSLKPPGLYQYAYGYGASDNPGQDQ